jgi:hypothetical protein
MKDGANCYTCKYRVDLMLDTHSACYHPKVKRLTKHSLVDILSRMGGRNDIRLKGGKNALGVKGHDRGIENGWFNWPFDFDPIWLEHCEGWE